MNASKPQLGLRPDSALGKPSSEDATRRPDLDTRLPLHADKQPSPSIDSARDASKGTKELAPKGEKLSTLLAQNLGLFERPKIKQPSATDPEAQPGSSP